MSAFWKVFIILKVLVNRDGPNSQGSLHSVSVSQDVDICCEAVCALCSEFCSIA